MGRDQLVQRSSGVISPVLWSTSHPSTHTVLKVWAGVEFVMGRVPCLMLFCELMPLYPALCKQENQSTERAVIYPRASDPDKRKHLSPSQTSAFHCGYGTLTLNL